MVFGWSGKTREGRQGGRQGAFGPEDGNKVDNEKEKIQDWEGENSRNEKKTKRKRKGSRLGG